MFDDPAAEIADLTTAIKHDIQGLNAAISDLQGLSHSGWGEGNRQSSVHSETVVDNLRARLKDATMEFKDVLTRRSDNLKSHQDRRSLYGMGTRGCDPGERLPCGGVTRAGTQDVARRSSDGSRAGEGGAT